MNYVDALPNLIEALSQMARRADACGKEIEIVVLYQEETMTYEILVCPIGGDPIETVHTTPTKLQLQLLELEQRYPSAVVIYP